MANQVPQKVRVVHPKFAPNGVNIPGAHLAAYEHRGYKKAAIPAPEPVEAKPAKPKKEKPNENVHSEE